MRPDLTHRARSLRNNPTEAEKALWAKLKHGQMGVKFRRQHPVRPYVLDFFCAERGLVIEVDGGQHNENKRDDERTAFLESKGYVVLRFWNNEVLGNIEGVIEMVRNTLSALPPLSPFPQVGGGNSNPWRRDFPVLERAINNRPVAYLDSAASAQKPQAVIDAMREVMEDHYANIHRGLYEFSQVTTQKFEGVRAKVAAFIGGAEKEIVFTRNATEAINLVAQSWGRAFLRRGDEVILTEMEHHANIVPWQLLRDQTGIVIKTIPVRDDGTLDLDAFARMLTPAVKLVSAVHISNALGTINNVKKITEIAKKFNPEIKVLVDGSQAAVHNTVNVRDIGCDFYVLTGHKLYGPTGAGVLWGRYDVLETMPPYQGGGDMIEQVTFERTTYKPPPARFEAGTPAIVEVIGLGAALDYLNDIGMDAIMAHEADLLAYAMQALEEVEGLTFYGTGPEKAGIISFTAAWGHPGDIGMILDQCGVAVRTGHHCCQPIMKRFGTDATIRASLGLYSNREDIDALAAGLKKAKELLE